MTSSIVQEQISCTLGCLRTSDKNRMSRAFKNHQACKNFYSKPTYSDSLLLKSNPTGWNSVWTREESLRGFNCTRALYRASECWVPWFDVLIGSLQIVLRMYGQSRRIYESAWEVLGDSVELRRDRNVLNMTHPPIFLCLGQFTLELQMNLKDQQIYTEKLEPLLFIQHVSAPSPAV